ncbi:MAG: PAS domain S-box protein [Deltaproteobacteria bacterium]|nr:MAG: PAS domain S-box protein [Deltaproteobacteria bacterium]
MGRFFNIHHTLSFRLIFWVGLVLLISISTWAYFNIKYQKQRAVEEMVAEADRLGNTIKLGTHYAMMLNSRDDINQITTNIGRQKEIENIRIYNKEGQIKFSSRTEEVDQTTNIKAEACFICHKQDPPLEKVELADRTRIFDSSGGFRLLGIISPIYNEPGCSRGSCHVHPKDKKVLGALDVVISLVNTDKEIASYTRGIIGLAIIIFLGASAIIGIFLLRFVNRPIKELITGAHHIGDGDYNYKVDVIDRDDEMGQLATAINEMRREIREKQEELSKQREEYQNIFELAPCYITVQGRDLRLIRYNREFAEQFAPKPGDYCYKAYKGRSEPCAVCPVMRTFEDGKSHYSEESGVSKDGTKSFWVVRTSPIRDAKGEVTAAMELCLDITKMKYLEKEVEKSEEKYRSIFNSIPNPVFVLDGQSLEILDCNDSVTPVYGFSKDQLLTTSFLKLFEEDSRERYASELKSTNVLNQARQMNRAGQTIFVNIRISPYEYLGRDVFLVTTSDITKRLMTEQQLIQASKMTTLGEMATGVAHELNQPLSVIKTASSFLSKKVKKNEEIKDEILKTLTEEIESHVDRASKIISHMREFGRKSEVIKERVQINETLDRAHEIFSQQLKLREIEVLKDYEENLPLILADSNRLEQVFINLLINARDAIEEKLNELGHRNVDKKIFLKTSYQGRMIKIEVRDTGKGIPQPILDKIFEPFFTTKEVGRGTGLGLSISYGIVKDYDGTIKVETEEGEGSNFIIMFPVPDEA